MSMKYWKVTLSCLTPVFIGSGDKFSKSEYILHKNKLYLLRNTEWAKFLSDYNLIDELVQAMNINLQRFSLKKDFIEKSSILNRKFGGTDEVLEALVAAKAVESLAIEDEVSKVNDVLSFIKNGSGRRYIPGSSLKGALRTAILANGLKQNPKLKSSYWHRLLSIYQTAHGGIKKDVEKLLDNLEKELGITPDDNKKYDLVNSRFRGLSVSDAEVITDKAVLIQKHDLSYYADKARSLSVFRECLDTGSRASFTVGIDAASDKMGALGIKDLDSLLQGLADFMDFQYTLYKDPFAENAPKAVDMLMDAHFVIGGGSGFTFKTLIYSLAPDKNDAIKIVRTLMQEQFKKGKHENDREISPHTLKLSDDYDYNGNMMGLCYIEEDFVEL